MRKTQARRIVARAAETVRELMSTKVQTVRADDDVALAHQMMVWSGVRQLPVMRDADVVGVVTERDVQAQRRGAHGEARRPVAAVMSARPRTAHPDETVGTAAARMADARVDCLPVLEDGRLIGIVTTTDVLLNEGRAHARRSGAPTPTAADVMTPKPLTVRPGDPLRAALSIMIDAEVRHLPVVDGDGRLVGMLSDRDVRAAVGDPIEMLERRPCLALDEADIESVMTTSPIAVRAVAPLSELAACLLNGRIGAVPVLDDDDRVVGIASYLDVLRHLLWAAR
jgi:CBS domain-containing protein